MTVQVERRKYKVTETDILKAWHVLAKSRLDKDFWANIGAGGKPREQTGGKVPGRILLCEALECFLVPALSPLLAGEFERVLKLEVRDRVFIDAFIEDTNTLIDSVFTFSQGHAIKTRFYSDPYIQLDEIKKGTQTPQNIDCAAFVTSTLLHLWQLFAPGSWLDQKLVATFCDKVDINSIPKLVDVCVSYILRCHEPGRGWRWTDNDKIPSTLYFTWTVCETFSEIDDVVLARERLPDLQQSADPLDLSTWDREKTSQSLFKFDREALCKAICSARTWALEQLEGVSVGTQVKEPVLMDPRGVTNAKYPCFPGEEYKSRKQDPKKAEDYVLWLNNLMLLDILALTYGDKDPNFDFTQELMERALMSLLEIYKSSEAKEVLDNYEYMFYLHPGEGQVLDINALSLNRSHSLYGDKSFPQLLTRVLILFLQYNVGNSIILGEQVASLYRSLLEGRNRLHQYVWDRDGLNVYATERALEALHDYHLLLASDEEGEQTKPLAARTPLDDVLDDFAGRLKQALQSLTADIARPEATLHNLERRVDIIEQTVQNPDRAISQTDLLQVAGKFTEDVKKLKDKVEKLDIWTKQLQKLDQRLRDIEDLKNVERE